MGGRADGRFGDGWRLVVVGVVVATLMNGVLNNGHDRNRDLPQLYTKINTFRLALEVLETMRFIVGSRV